MKIFDLIHNKIRHFGWVRTDQPSAGYERTERLATCPFGEDISKKIVVNERDI